MALNSGALRPLAASQQSMLPKIRLLPATTRIEVVDETRSTPSQAPTCSGASRAARPNRASMAPATSLPVVIESICMFR
ncbi:hypothetical protein DNJ95_18480 [Stutzerimonas kirkiae]|uniref:Uncharacterized protein n=1 Tax=Stutzerimonas kirkiae TaxID=2211392 RepID=A0A4Q9QYL0_9GAMM|nr:hypothetical protein DNJ96_17000 [Stutzerimonas kirkiae]TBU98213.1 hypothetical protein DNJ95_18480 [Stutzerimonas kirkiae]TBV10181.1 hypothetical protein DNK01_18155 [Stutzerimonas kirkiae]